MSKILSLKPEFDVIFKNEDMSINEKLTVILDNTIAYYTINKRCYTDGSGCMYSPQKSRGRLTFEDTEGCAIGRLLTNESAFELDNMSDLIGSINKLIQLNENKVLGYEFPELILNNEYFFIRLQKLHDDEINWNEEGLTDIGKKAVESIRDYLISI